MMVNIPVGEVTLEGNLNIPEEAKGIVLFAYGSGSSRHSPGNKKVAGILRENKFATLLVDLLTEEEERIDIQNRKYRFDIELLALRLTEITDWLTRNEETRYLQIGYFGSSTGAAGALIAASRRQHLIGAVVSRGGRPDLAEKYLEQVKAPTLLIVGGNDVAVIGMNEQALNKMNGNHKMEIVEGATHLFEEPGKLHEVTVLAKNWFSDHLGVK
jgi:putative phosphoribosyl transferase